MAASQSLYSKNHQLLLQLMNKASIASMKELSQISGIPELQLIRLEHGLLPKMQIETLLKLSKALQISVDKMLALFCSESLPPATIDRAESVALDTLKQEYQNLQQTLAQQQETLEQQFQQESIQRIESWLLQWPTAAAVAQQNPQFSAAKILPLAKPISDLLKHWGVEAIATVGEKVSYDPQWHQLMEGVAEQGELVKVRYAGYRQGEKLLYRAKVSLVKDEGEQVESG